MQRKGTIRPVLKSDRKIIEKFLRGRITIHRHLDWRQPLDWLGKYPFFLFQTSPSSIEALLNCVPEINDNYWVRLFAFSNPFKGRYYWNLLFHEALQFIADHSQNPSITSLAYQRWMQDMLEQDGWIENQKVIQFKWDDKSHKKIIKPYHSPSNIRLMTQLDLDSITQIDHQCFNPVWQQSPDAYKHAFNQARYATLYRIDQKICGFQISTSEKGKAHLARIAVHPDYQRRHIGETLLQDMLKYFHSRGIKHISVNTQQENTCSIALYKKLQFIPTGDSFPIFTYM